MPPEHRTTWSPVHPHDTSDDKKTLGCWRHLPFYNDWKLYIRYKCILMVYYVRLKTKDELQEDQTCYLQFVLLDTNVIHLCPIWVTYHHHHWFDILYFDHDVCTEDSPLMKAMCACDWIRWLIFRLDSITKSFIATRARVRHIPCLRFGVRTLDDSFRTTYLGKTYIDVNRSDRGRNNTREVFIAKRL